MGRATHESPGHPQYPSADTCLHTRATHSEPHDPAPEIPVGPGILWDSSPPRTGSGGGRPRGRKGAQHGASCPDPRPRPWCSVPWKRPQLQGAPPTGHPVVPAAHTTGPAVQASRPSQSSLYWVLFLPLAEQKPRIRAQEPPPRGTTWPGPSRSPAPTSLSDG